MNASSSSTKVHRFGVYEFDAGTGELRKQGMRVRLEGQPVSILTILLERRGEVVTREELQSLLWQSDTFVDFEQSLNAAIRRLRLALNDSAEHPRYVETLARKGYRWIAPMDAGVAPPEVQAPEQVKTHSQWRRGKLWIMLATAAALAGLLIAMIAMRPRTEPARVMLAVLPFQNLSGEAQEEYLADGMTEEMITQLGSLDPERLGVIARTSAMQYKNAHKEAAEIARELRVQYLLEGSIRLQGERIRVTAQLIRASDQTHVWADNYDSDIGDILKVESEAARAIAGQIRLKLTRETNQRLSSVPKVNPQAHDAYLQGLQALNLRSKEGTQRSIEDFKRAVDIDPNDSLAWAALARAYALSPVTGYLTSSEAMPAGREAAQRAIGLDDSVAQGHTVLAFIKAHYEFDWAGAEHEYQRALALNPSDPLAHFFYSNSYLSPLGRHDEAIAEMKKAVELDPFSAPVQSFLGRTYLWARRYDESLAQFEKTVEMFPGFGLNHERLAHLYTYRGDFDKAIAEETKARILTGEDPRAVLKREDGLREALARRGPLGYWEKLLDAAQENDNPPEAYTTSYGVAIIYARLGDKQKALRSLEQAYEEPQLAMTEVGVEPAFDVLRAEPKFQEVLQRVRLAPQSAETHSGQVRQ
jgi:TolB-like protein/DNA-binding winged helix-turn-helix (wHTH) protein/Tfp pilus assembly protein PilF